MTIFKQRFFISTWCSCAKLNLSLWSYLYYSELKHSDWMFFNLLLKCSNAILKHLFLTSTSDAIPGTQ